MIRSRRTTRRLSRLALVAGLVALVLQVLAPALPPAAMAGAMTLAAATPEEAASFAATCLGLGRPDLSDKAPADHAAKCPICLSIAQNQGMAPMAPPVAIAFAWQRMAPVNVTSLPQPGILAAAFASRAPPVA